MIPPFSEWPNLAGSQQCIRLLKSYFMGLQNIEESAVCMLCLQYLPVERCLTALIHAHQQIRPKAPTVSQLSIHRHHENVFQRDRMHARIGVYCLFHREINETLVSGSQLSVVMR